MSNNYFQFKRFTVTQNHSAMKVGTDGVLLGSWAEPKAANHILDIGCGTGLLALMMAQKSLATIDALEIDTEACKDAQFNFSQSPWNERIQLIEDDFIYFSQNIEKHYDVIVSNPPFFKDSLHSPHLQKNTARHTNSLPHEKLIEGVARLLTADGLFYVVIPTDISKAFITNSRLQGLHPQTILHIFSKETDLKPIRSLICFGRNDCRSDERSMLIYKQASYSEEYKALTAEFYLNF